MEQADEASNEVDAVTPEDQSDLAKLTALMDEEGSIPPHGETGEPEEAANKADEDTESPETDPKGQSELLEVEYEGKQYKVPPELKDALLRRADYTQKTQEVAAERAAAQQERQLSKAAVVEAQKFGQFYTALSAVDSQLQELNKIDFNQLRVTDPVTELQYRQRAHDLLRTRDTIAGQLNAAHQQVSQAEMQQFAQQVEQGNKVLAQEVPNWGPETQRALAETATGRYGFKPEEIQGLSDPRMVRVLHDAHRYQQLQAKRAEVSKQVQRAVPKPVRASATRETSNEPAGAQREIARLRKSHSDDDAVAALSKLIG